MSTNNCNIESINTSECLHYIKQCVKNSIMFRFIGSFIKIDILDKFIHFFDILLNDPKNIKEEEFDIFFVDLPNGLNLFYNLSLRHIIKEKLSHEDEIEINEGRALNLQSKLPTLAKFPHIDIAVSTLFSYLKNCLCNDKELLDRLKQRIISKEFNLHEKKHVFTIDYQVFDLNPMEQSLWCENEDMFYILSYLMCKGEGCLSIQLMKKCDIFNTIKNDLEIIKKKEQLQLDPSDRAEKIQQILTNMYAKSILIECHESEEEKEEEPETEENNKLSIHFWTSAYSCLEMQLEKKIGTRLSRKIGFGLDEMRSGLTIQGILSAILQSTKGNKQPKDVEKVYVSPLFYTWTTAILLYGPHIEQDKTLSLFVSPFLATPNFSFRGQINKTNIIIDKFEKINFLLNYILISLFQLNRLNESEIYLNLIEQITKLLTLTVSIHTYTEPSKTYKNIVNYAYSFKNLVELSAGDPRELLKKKDEEGPEKEKRNYELFTLVSKIKNKNLIENDYIIDQILHFVEDNLNNTTIGIKQTILKKENIIDNSNKTKNVNKTTNDIKGNIHSFIRFVPRTETNIHAVIPNQLMDHFLRKKHTGYSVTGYQFELNYEDDTNIINKSITKIIGIPFPKLDNTITSCEVECDFKKPRNCSKKMKNAKGVLNLDTMFEKYVTGKKYKKIYTTSKNKPIIKQSYIPQLFNRTHKYQVVPTGGTKLQSHRTRRNRK